MPNLKSVEVVFENCECIEIFYPDISYIQIHGLEQKIGNYSNCISKHDTIDGFEMFISGDAVLSHLQEDVFPNVSLDRFKLCDITQLDIKWDDGTNDYVFVRWTGDSDYTHPNQKAIVSPDGNLYISSHVNIKIKEITDEILDNLDRGVKMKKSLKNRK